jgi:redox-sensitive bicupin YhaK (pirin superfamily)
MSNVEADPAETACRSATAGGPVTEFFESRVVPLGGMRGAITVNRSLPQRALPTVGAWCFLDLFGPQRTDMRVLPHPHTCLQTVTWTLAGEVRHRDSLGSDVVIRPGQLNLMTSGRGIAHSEYSLGEQGQVHGLQLWVALPGRSAGQAPAFEHHEQLPVHEANGVRATVFLGALGEVASPATTYSPLLGAELLVAGGSAATLPLRSDFEHALLVIEGGVKVAGTALASGPLLYLGVGRSSLDIAAPVDTRAILLGGTPFPDDLVMWWNFVGRSHEEIAAARADWESMDGQRFGPVLGSNGERIPAPPLPTVRLLPRRR